LSAVLVCLQPPPRRLPKREPDSEPRRETRESAGPRIDLASRALDQTIDLLAANRLEHLGVTISPDRHWTWVGENRAAVLTRFDLASVQAQLMEFHRDQGEGRTLSAAYAFAKEDAEDQLLASANSGTEPTAT
jgi:hypothetical protein